MNSETEMTLFQAVLYICRQYGQTEIVANQVRVTCADGETWTFSKPERIDGTDAEKIYPAAPATAQGKYAALIELFDTVHIDKGIEFPQMHLGGTTFPMKIYRAGPKSAHPGSITILVNGNNYAGRITRGGELNLARSAYEINAAIEYELTSFMDDKEKYAGRYGRETNHCMFCNLTLTEEFSVKHGYGPICAENYGLPHGQHERKRAKG